MYDLQPLPLFHSFSLTFLISLFLFLLFASVFIIHCFCLSSVQAADSAIQLKRSCLLCDMLARHQARRLLLLGKDCKSPLSRVLANPHQARHSYSQCIAANSLGIHRHYSRWIHLPHCCSLPLSSLSSLSSSSTSTTLPEPPALSPHFLVLPVFQSRWFVSQLCPLQSPFPHVMIPFLMSSGLPLPAIMSCCSFLLPGTCLIGHSVCAGPPSSTGTKPFFIIPVSLVTAYPHFKEKRVCVCVGVLLHVAAVAV